MSTPPPPEEEEEPVFFIPPPPSWLQCDVHNEEEVGQLLLPAAPSFEEEEDTNATEVDDATDASSRRSTPPPSPLPVQNGGIRENASSIAKEVLTNVVEKSIHYSRTFYASRKTNYRNTDLGSVAGFPLEMLNLLEEEGGSHHSDDEDLPPFSSLDWSDRQLVKEWRTIDFSGEDDNDFEAARRLYPRPLSPKPFSNSDNCHTCKRRFHVNNGSRKLLLRHHCRLCSRSFCGRHSAWSHSLPHLGYDPQVSERVCEECKDILEERDWRERIAWRLARCRDYWRGDLTPYFETGLDTMEDVARRIAQYTLHLTRQIPLGAQATIAVETVEVLRKHGLQAIYGLILRHEFLAAADLLRKVAGIDEKSWPLSVHELSAAIFYALAQYRWIRGVDPEHEHRIHALIGDHPPKQKLPLVREEKGPIQNPIIDETDTFDPMAESVTNLLTTDHFSSSSSNQNKRKPTPIQHPRLPLIPVCTPLPSSTLSSLLFYAPLALDFIYSLNAVDMQLLAAQQDWILLYAYLQQCLADDHPANALFLHPSQKIACLAVRGTATVQDVVTDIRAIPVPFPEIDDSNASSSWHVLNSGCALCGMVRAAHNLYKENAKILLSFAKRGYRIRIVGHSLGGGVAALLGILIQRDLRRELLISNTHPEQSDILRVYAYGTPACMDGRLAAQTTSFVTSVVLHDDVVPRLTPTSIRKLLKHLLYIRKTWVKEHFEQDMSAIASRFLSAWAPRWRGSFVLLGKKTKIKKWASFSEGTSSNNNDKDKSSHSSQVIWEDEEDFDIRRSSSEIDGEMFYEAEEDLIESDDESFTGLHDGTNWNVGFKKGANQTAKSQREELAPFDEPEPVVKNEDDNCDDTPEPSVLLEESPLPRMFIPGKIVHVYTHNGGYKASYVPRSFRELRRISLAANMLKDHMSRSYYEALLEVRNIRKAKEPLPAWDSFCSSPTCYCCASKFTWASTCDSTAQEARDKHNCRCCGSLVCHHCSMNRVPLTKMGIEVPVRVCDKCFYDMGGVLSSTTDLMSSYLEDRSKQESCQTSTVDGQRRRNLVDDLVKRIQSSSLSVAHG